MKPTSRALLAAGVALVGISLWGWWSGTRSVREAQAALEQLEARRAELERRNRTLARQIEALRRDAAARERAAREYLGVVSPEETVVLLPTPTASPSPPLPATPALPRLR